MQKVVNVGHIKEQQRRGRWLAIIGFAALAGAFLLVWQRTRPELILVAYGAMLLGFVAFNSGLQTVAKFSSNSRKLRADQQLDKALTRLNDRYTIIHYAQLGKRVVEHLLIGNNGVLVLTVRELPGEISVKGRKWRRGGNPFGRLFNYSGPQLGNPTLENETDIAAVKAVLAEQQLPDAVDGVIVFTNPAVTVRVADSPVDVIDLDGLPDYIRTAGREHPPLATKERLAMVEALSQGRDLEQTTLRAERRRRAA